MPARCSHAVTAGATPPNPHGERHSLGPLQSSGWHPAAGASRRRDARVTRSQTRHGQKPGGQPCRQFWTNPASNAVTATPMTSSARWTPSRTRNTASSTCRSDQKPATCRLQRFLDQLDVAQPQVSASKYPHSGPDFTPARKSAVTLRKHPTAPLARKLGRSGGKWQSISAARARRCCRRRRPAGANQRRRLPPPTTGRQNRFRCRLLMTPARSAGAPAAGIMNLPLTNTGTGRRRPMERRHLMIFLQSQSAHRVTQCVNRRKDAPRA